MHTILFNVLNGTLVDMQEILTEILLNQKSNGPGSLNDNFLTFYLI